MDSIEQTITSRYPLKKRMLVYAILGLLVMYILIWLFTFDRGWQAHSGKLLINFIKDTAHSIIHISILLLLVSSQSYLLYRYRLDGSELECFNPFTRKRRHVNLTEVHQINRKLQSTHKLGKGVIYFLATTDNKKAMLLSDELPIWPEILKRCTSVQFQDRHEYDLPAEAVPNTSNWKTLSNVQYPEYYRKLSESSKWAILLAVISYIIGSGFTVYFVEKFHMLHKEQVIAVLFVVQFCSMYYLISTIVRHIFFRNSYSLMGSFLEVHDPIKNTRLTMDLSNLKKIKHYKAGVVNPSLLGSQAYIFIDHKGQKIKISKALPIWDDVLERCPESIKTSINKSIKTKRTINS
jgi:hypothetical protein